MGTDNLAPTIDNLDGDLVVDYDPSSDPAQILDNGADALVADTDSANFDTGSVTVSAVVAGEAGDELRVNGAALNTGDTVMVGGSNIGTIAQDGVYPNDLVIDLNANATPALTSQLLQQITFATDPGQVVEAGRTIEFGCRVEENLWYHTADFETLRRGYHIDEVWRRIIEDAEKEN